MCSEHSNSGISSRETARLEAKANLLLGLYSHTSNDLERARAEVDQLRGELAEVHSMLAQARLEAERVHSEMADLGRLMGERVRELNCLAEQHDAVLNSTSWRITAPMRAATRLIQRQ